MRTLLIIFSERRHGSTSLCTSINSLNDCTSFYELTQRGHYPRNQFEGKNVSINKLIKFILSNHNDSILSFKLFHDQIKKDDIPKLLKKTRYTYDKSGKSVTEEIRIKCLVLRRNLKDSYISFLRAIKYNDWGTIPTANRNNKNIKIVPSKFNAYKKTINEYLDFCSKQLLKNNIDHRHIHFNDLIKTNFDVNDLIDNLVYNNK